MNCRTVFSAPTMTIAAALQIAERVVLGNRTAPMNSSARLALADAMALAAKDENLHAGRRAADAIAYVVGVFHHDYVSVAEGLGHYN